MVQDFEHLTEPAISSPLMDGKLLGHDDFSVKDKLMQALVVAAVVLLLCGCAAGLVDCYHRQHKEGRYSRLHETREPSRSPSSGAGHAGGCASGTSATTSAATNSAKALEVHKFMQHAAEASAQERYSMALAEAQAMFKQEEPQDLKSATLNHMEAQKRASIEYARDLQELAAHAKAANDAFVESMAPARALEAEEEMANMEAMMVKAAEHAAARAKAAEGSEAASRVSRQEAAARVTGKIRAKERQRQQEELAFDNLQGGAVQGGHLALKPPLPRRKTIARSYLYGSSDRSDQSLEDAERGGVGSSIIGGGMGSVGWCISNSPTSSPSPSALQPAASSRSVEPVGHGSPPRDINNLYPHASRVLASLQWVATSLPFSPRRPKSPALPPSTPPPTKSSGTQTPAQTSAIARS